MCAELRGRGVLALRLRGELDLATDVALRGVLHGLDLPDLRHVDLDVSDLSFSDGRGCAVLLVSSTEPVQRE